MPLHLSIMWLLKFHESQSIEELGCHCIRRKMQSKFENIVYVASSYVIMFRNSVILRFKMNFNLLNDQFYIQSMQLLRFVMKNLVT
jgi:hypothetical protein